MTEDQSSSPAPIPYDVYPIVCAQCNYNLRGLPDPGRCPECFTPYDHSEDRALYLFEQHGPEAFLPKDWQEELKRQPRGWRALRQSLAAVVVSLALLAAVVVGYYLATGTIQIFSVGAIWFILLIPVERLFFKCEKNGGRESGHDSAIGQ